MGKNQDPGSGISISDPQHWYQVKKLIEDILTAIEVKSKIWMRIRISAVRIRGSGSVSKRYGSGHFMERYPFRTTVLSSVVDPNPVRFDTSCGIRIRKNNSGFGQLRI
jgi:hypothetical protein